MIASTAPVINSNTKKIVEPEKPKAEVKPAPVIAQKKPVEEERPTVVVPKVDIAKIKKDDPKQAKVVIPEESEESSYTDPSESKSPEKAKAQRTDEYLKGVIKSSNTGDTLFKHKDDVKEAAIKKAKDEIELSQAEIIKKRAGGK